MQRSREWQALRIGEYGHPGEPAAFKHEHIQPMKNIQVIDGAINCVFDIFAATDEEFALIFPAGQDVAFIDEVRARADTTALDEAFCNIWRRRLPKINVNGIHGLLFYESGHKKVYYPTRRDEEAINPDGTRLRA